MQNRKKVKAQPARDLMGNRGWLNTMESPAESLRILSFLQTLIDTIPGAIFYKDRNGIYRGCNKAYEIFLGLEKDHIVGKTVHEVFPKDLADKYAAMDHELFVNPGKQIYEWQMNAANGTRRDVIISKATFSDVDGSVDGLVGVMIDITERKRAEKALAEAEERYRSIFENALEGIFQSSPEGRIISVNPAHARIFGYDSPREMMNTFEDIGHGHYVHSEDRQKFREICDSQGFIRDFEVQFYTKSGDKIWVSLNARVVKSSEGNILYYEGIAEDITKRVNAEKALQDSQRILTEIIDFLPDPTFAVDQYGRVLVWNKAIEDMTSVRGKDMIGKGDYEYALPFYGFRRPMLVDLLFQENEMLEKYYVFIKKEGDVITGESLRPVSGVHRVLWGKAAFLYDSEGVIIGAIESIRDITQKRESEEVLKKREQELLIKTRSLEEINIALKVLLGQQEKDKNDFENNIALNMQKLVNPYIDKLKNSILGPAEAAYVKVLDLSLRDITSPFINKLSAKLAVLTPREIEVAKLVKDGKSTKEIADFLHSTVRAIEFHRDHIRKKLGLNNSNKNLRSYLLSLS